MFYGDTVDGELCATLKGDSGGEAMRRCQRQLEAALEKAEHIPCKGRKDTSIKAFQAGMALLPALWRDLNRR